MAGQTANIFNGRFPKFDGLPVIIRGDQSQLTKTAMPSELADRIRSLPCWSGKIECTPVEGGITNQNFKVVDGRNRYFVRTGVDIPVHGVMRFNELAAARAAQAVGLSPAIVHNEPGIMVCEFVDGRTFAEEDVRQMQNLSRILELIRRCHDAMPMHFRGPALIFWVFHVIRDYMGELRARNSTHRERLPDLAKRASLLEAAVGPVRIVFGHNDLLPANFIDDGERLWLVDWDYAGFNSPLFDLANLASNNGLSREQEAWLLESYFGGPPSERLVNRFSAMKCASLLRETLWSMVSEIHSTLDFDYAQYTAENLSRFEAAYEKDKHGFIDHAGSA